MSVFQNAKIYKILNSVNPKVYVGSTTKDLSTRFNGHKATAKRGDCMSRVLFREDRENCKIELIEDYPCNNDIELRKRETFWKDQLDCVNKNRPIRTEESKKQYRIDYAEKHNLNQKFVCECGGRYTKRNTKIHKNTEMHKKWEKKQMQLTWKDIPTEIVIEHIFPWVMQFKFRDCKIPRMLIDYTDTENPKMLIEYNKLDNFTAAQNLQVLFEKMKFQLQESEIKMNGVLHYSDDYDEFDKLPFFLLMMRESSNKIEDFKKSEDTLDFYKAELLGGEWDFSEYEFYLEALCDKRFSEQLFDKLLVERSLLVEAK